MRTKRSGAWPLTLFLLGCGGAEPTTQPKTLINQETTPAPQPPKAQQLKSNLDALQALERLQDTSELSLACSPHTTLQWAQASSKEAQNLDQLVREACVQGRCDRDKLVKVIQYYARLPQAQQDAASAQRSGYAQLFFVIESYQAAREVKLDGPISELKVGLDQKVKHVTQVKKQTTELLQLQPQGPIALASLAYFAASMLDMAESLRNVPVPQSLDEEQASVYRDAIEERAAPMEEMGLSAVKQRGKAAGGCESDYARWLDAVAKLHGSD